ncbi:MAG TPA: hydrogen gas-evolving membrane-bound hydrogenase subunit E [Thermomicrobiales bacterium]
MLTDHWNATLVLLVTALAAAPLTALAGFWRRTLATPVAIVTTAAAFAAALWGWAEGGPTLDAPWAPAWNLRLTFELDGLAALYSLLATGIGLAVVIYASRYIPLHLAHSERDQGDIVRFYGFLLLFMGAMVGLVMAQDLFLIFLFWDLTAISSYFLIGYDSEREDARASALMAFLITGISAVCFLIGALLLYSEYGTFALPDLMARTESSRLVTTAVALISAAALAKSAQAPLHFWLPRAMAAPTPVSAYLHSAAMVAAGVFLLGRVHPLLEKSDVVMNALVVIGFASMATGGCLALTRKVLKQLLAYSTISQYGYVVVMLGIGGADGAAAASFYVIAHALMKCALFLTAGAVTEATGQKALTGLGGLWRRMPLLAVGSGAAAAGLAALPLTAGFFKDELFFKAADHEGNPIRLLAVAGAALTFAYSWRFWGGIFAGPLQTEPKPLSIRLTAPVAVLGALVLLGGVWPHPFARLAEDAATVTAGTPVHIEVAYHLDSRVENVMAIAAIAVGLVLIFSRPLWQPALVAISTTTVRFGPERLYWAVLLGLNRLSDRMHRIEIHDLRGRVATILLPAGLLVGAGVAVTPGGGTFRIGSLSNGDLPEVLMLTVAALAAITAALARDHLSLALVLSGVGFSLAVVYALLGSPDVALVAVLIETIFALLFVGMLALLPREGDEAIAVITRDREQRLQADNRGRDAVLSAIAGGLAFIVAWGILSKPAPLESVITSHIRLAPVAHGKDIVTVILADFRGLDTMGEITVIGIAFLGIATYLRRWRTR